MMKIMEKKTNTPTFLQTRIEKELDSRSDSRNQLYRDEKHG